MPTVLSITDFKMFFDPVFSDPMFTNPRVLDALEQAKSEVEEAMFGKHYRRAVYYLTAHLLSLFTQMIQKAELAPGSSVVTAPVGMMTSASVGDLSLTLEVPEYNREDDKLLASTSFGQEYLRLRNKMCRGGFAITKRPGIL